jgi:SSS family transporter
MSIYLIFVLVYLAGLIIVGARKASSIQSQSDFALAGRGLSTFVLTGTLLATWIGTGSIFGNGEEAYRVGMAAWIIPLAGATGIFVLTLLASRVRKEDNFTIQDILERSFGPSSRIIGTITLTMAYVIIVSYQYRAGAAIVEQIAPALPHLWAVIMVAVFVTLYTYLAGMYSVAYTDVVNGILMTVGFLIAIPILIFKAGGISGIVDSLPTAKQAFMGHYSWGTLISILLPSLLLILGDANLYGRFFSAKSPEDAQKSARWMLVAVLIMEWIIIFTAIIGIALVAQGVIVEPENIGHIIVQMAFGALPPILGAVLMATVVAIVVSTADSYLLAPASAIVRDVYQRFFHPQASEAKLVSVSRNMVLILGAVALVLAFMSDKFFSVSLFAYTLYGASITPALLASLFWKGAHRKAGTPSMVAGLVTALLWKYLQSQGWLPQAIVAMDLDAVVPAALLSTLTLVGVSLCYSQQNKTI